MLATAFMAAFYCASQGVGAQDAPYTGWEQATTRHFRFIYEEAFRAEAAEYASVADEIWNRIAEAYDEPPHMTDIIVTGRTDRMGAWVEGITPSMWLYTDAPVTPDFGYRESWQTLVFTHELAHVADFTFDTGSSTLEDVFGPTFGAFRFGAVPGWEYEGLATVLETDLTRGGRGRSPHFELQYKALTLDDSFLDYAEIGEETRPPERQIYVAGYLIMRSIADRFGLSALADLERNRAGGRSFAESVKLVTGETPEVLWQDVKRALVRRYAAERVIPEGTTVTPRDTGVSWYRPALVTDEAIIGLRKGADGSIAAASLDPSTGIETVLFESSFADERSFAAAENDFCVAALQTWRNDSQPGSVTDTDLWAWTQKAGLTRLTEGASLFQPALSREGNRLVAVESKGLRSRLVEIDPESGEIKILLESETESFVQPALSADGSTVAFLVLDGSRAALATAPMPRYEFAYPVPGSTVTVIANGSGPVVDLSDPSWTADGKLLCASNARGRLEIWQWEGTKGTPVVADPAGAYWADLRPNGIVYASFASSGFVLRMKPASEWGIVPDFHGPSEPGEPIRLGAYLSDYPDYEPWPGLEAETTEKTPKETAAETTVLRREEIPGRDEPITELSAGTAFFNIPTLKFWFPWAGAIALNDTETVYGAGAYAFLGGYPIQEGSRETWLLAGGTAWPSLSQADAIVAVGFPLYTGNLYAIASREYGRDAIFGDGLFRETGIFMLSWALPVRSVRMWADWFDGALVAGIQARTVRASDNGFSANEGPQGATAITAQTGLDISWRSVDSLSNGRIYEADGNLDLLTSAFPGTESGTRLSYAFATRVAAGTGDAHGGVLFEISLRGRWFDLPPGVPLPDTLATTRGADLDATWPGRLIAAPALVFEGNGGVSGRVYGEKLLSWGENGAGYETPRKGTPLNLALDPWYYAGVEASAQEGRSRFAAGIVTKFREGEEWDALSSSRIYLEYKLDALRGVAR